MNKKTFKFSQLLANVKNLTLQEQKEYFKKALVDYGDDYNLFNENDFWYKANGYIAVIEAIETVESRLKYKIKEVARLEALENKSEEDIMNIACDKIQIDKYKSEKPKYWKTYHYHDCKIDFEDYNYLFESDFNEWQNNFPNGSKLQFYNYLIKNYNIKKENLEKIEDTPRPYDHLLKNIGSNNQNQIIEIENIIEDLEQAKQHIQENYKSEPLPPQQNSNNISNIKPNVSLQLENKEDPFSITINLSENLIEFRKVKTEFPFDCLELFNLITNLRELIIKEDVCQTDLQQFPILIFEQTELKNYPDLSAYICNIIESWVTEYEITLHNGNKKRLFDNFLKLCEEKALSTKSLPPQQIEKVPFETKPERKYIAKEHALSYILDLYAVGKMIPLNTIEGSYNAKELLKIGQNKGFEKPDTFYRAVLDVLKFDLNKTKDLQSISNDWLNAVEQLSTNWVTTKQYLVNKNLGGE